MAAANQEMMIQIIERGLGFTIEQIQAALIATGNTTPEAAINYIFTNPDVGSAEHTGGVAAATIEEVKRRMATMSIAVSDSQVEDALKKSHNDQEKAFHWLLENLGTQPSPSRSQVKITSKEDADAVKRRLAEEAEERQRAKEAEEKEREADLARQQEEYERGQEERARKAAAHAKRVQEARRKVAQKKKSKEKERKAQRLKWHDRHDQYDARDQAVYEESRRARTAADQGIRSPQQAVTTILERYGEETAKQTLVLLQKICSNLLAHPGEDKYRRLNLDKKALKNKLVTPLGALKFLSFVGFQLDEERNALVLAPEREKAQDLREAVALLQKFTVEQETVAAQAIRAAEEAKMDAEDLYCGVVSLQEILRNLCISPQSEHLRFVAVDNTAFRNRVGRHKVFIHLMKQLGYKLDERRQFVFPLDTSQPLQTASHPQLRLLKAAVADLARAAKRLLPQTKVASVVAQLREHNAGNPQTLAAVRKLFGTCSTALQHVLDEPLETKFQTINLGKLKGKCGNITGMGSLLKALGYEAAGTHQATKAKLYKLPAPCDFDLLRMRRDILLAAAAL